MSDELYARLRRNRFVSIGRAGLDLYPTPDGTKIEDAETLRTDVGGSAGNIAVALVRQGSRAALLSPLADDPVGRFTRNRLAEYGVDTSLCRAIGGDARNTLALAETRAEDCEVVIYRNGAADLLLSEEDVAGLDLADTGAVIATGTALATEPSRSAVTAAFDRARGAGVPTVLDLDYRPYQWASPEEARAVYGAAAALSDVIVGNDEEFAVVARAGQAPLDAARALVARGAAIAIFKMGAEGSATISRDGELRTGIFAVETCKPFGAGDAFMGSLMASLGSGLPLAAAVERGSAAAAMVVARPGCASAMPSREQVDAFIAERAGTPVD